MIDPAAVRRIARELPETQDGSTDARIVVEVAGKGICWSFMERAEPKKPRTPRLDILAVRCSVPKKEMLVEAAPDLFFDDDHYRGYPAVLVRLAAIDEDELRDLLAEAWRLTAPKALVKRYPAVGG